MKFDLNNAKDFLAKVKDKVKKKDGPDEKNIQNGEQNESLENKGTKLFSKVGNFFNYEPQKERVLNQEDFHAAGDVYYASVSALYKVVERFLWVMLIIFVIFSLVTNYKEITYNNFFYLLRDFSTAADSQTSNYQVLSYDSNSRQNFEIYRGGLVSAAPSSVSVFTAGGRRTLKSNNDYLSPNVICCDKYVLVYDTGSAAFSVYNSFSKIYDGKLDAPITDACFDSDGSFALATRVNNARTLVKLYDKDINPIGEVPKSNFLFDMALDNSQNRFAAIYFDSGSGIGKTIICVYDTKESKDLAEIELDGEFPLACSYLENGTFCVITDSSIRLYGTQIKNNKLQEKEAYKFNEASVCAFNASREGCSVVISNGVPKNVIAFDKNGEVIYNNNIADNISDVAVFGKYVFLQTVSGVIRLDTKEDKTEYLPSNNGEMLIYDEETAIVCGEARAEYLVFGKKR